MQVILITDTIQQITVQFVVNFIHFINNLVKHLSKWQVSLQRKMIHNWIFQEMHNVFHFLQTIKCSRLIQTISIWDNWSFGRNSKIALYNLLGKSIHLWTHILATKSNKINNRNIKLNHSNLPVIWSIDYNWWQWQWQWQWINDNELEM